MEQNLEKMEIEVAAQSNFKSDGGDSRNVDTYTIPSNCSWFSWAEIHQIERVSLPEFFHGSSISRTSKTYLEYRNFIINKYREDSSRRLTFTEVRKSLVGDVNLLHKVFSFLDGYGLINFCSSESFPTEYGVQAAEEGVSHGIRVVGNPNLLKPNFTPVDLKNCGEIKPSLPSILSFSNVFSNFRHQEGETCENCGDPCEEERSKTCKNCIKNEKSEDIQSAFDSQRPWMDAEDLLLFESAQKHGNDWDAIAQNVKTKTKDQCISRLIELPFINKSASNLVDQVVNGGENMDIEIHGTVLKRKRLASFPGTDDLVMTQVSRISSVLGQRITTAAAEAVFSALCVEDPFLKTLFEDGNGSFINKLIYYFGLCHNSENDGDFRSLEEGEDSNFVPQTLQIRAVAALALGTAAGHARFLGERDEEKMEGLMGVVVEAQLKKLEWKLCILDQMEEMMVNMNKEMDEFLEHVLGERMIIVERSLDRCSSKVIQST